MKKLTWVLPVFFSLFFATQVQAQSVNDVNRAGCKSTTKCDLSAYCNAFLAQCKKVGQNCSKEHAVCLRNGGKKLPCCGKSKTIKRMRKQLQACLKKRRKEIAACAGNNATKSQIRKAKKALLCSKLRCGSRARCLISPKFSTDKRSRIIKKGGSLSANEIVVCGCKPCFKSSGNQCVPFCPRGKKCSIVEVSGGAGNNSVFFGRVESCK